MGFDPMPSIYKLSTVNEVTAEGGRQHYSFNVVGIVGKPLVSFSYDNRIDAEKARLEMMDSMTSAIETVPLFVR
jgi:hypothetical protein